MKGMFLTPHVTYACSNSIILYILFFSTIITIHEDELLIYHVDAFRETIIDWAIEQACGRFRSEILHISRVESGLHFNASQACTADILNFDLEEIAQRLEVLAPCTWHMVQGLLNSNPVACQGRVATKSAIYEKRHDIVEGSLGDLSNTGRSGGSEGRMGGMTEDEGEEGLDGGGGEKGAKCSMEDQGVTLL